jgi:hypothetical protein
MQFLWNVFQEVKMPKTFDQEGNPKTWEDRLYVNIPLGYTGSVNLPFYVQEGILYNPDGSAGPDVSDFIMTPDPNTPEVCFCGVDTLYLRDNDDQKLTEALSAWIVEEASSD